MTDLDRGGRIYQKVKVYRGPSLGWADIEVCPNVGVSVAGTFNVPLGTHTILVAVTGVTVQLPDLNVWVNNNVFYPGTTYENAIWVKDVSGLASVANPIIIAPFPGQLIDSLSQNFQIVQARGAIRLYPRTQIASGWASE